MTKVSDLTHIVEAYLAGQEPETVTTLSDQIKEAFRKSPKNSYALSQLIYGSTAPEDYANFIIRTFFEDKNWQSKALSLLDRIYRVHILASQLEAATNLNKQPAYDRAILLTNQLKTRFNNQSTEDASWIWGVLRPNDGDFALRTANKPDEIEESEMARGHSTVTVIKQGSIQAKFDIRFLPSFAEKLFQTYLACFTTVEGFQKQIDRFLDFYTNKMLNPNPSDPNKKHLSDDFFLRAYYRDVNGKKTFLYVFGSEYANTAVTLDVSLLPLTKLSLVVSNSYIPTLNIAGDLSNVSSPGTSVGTSRRTSVGEQFGPKPAEMEQIESDEGENEADEKQKHEALTREEKKQQEIAEENRKQTEYKLNEVEKLIQKNRDLDTNILSLRKQQAQLTKRIELTEADCLSFSGVILDTCRYLLFSKNPTSELERMLEDYQGVTQTLVEKQNQRQQNEAGLSRLLPPPQ